MKRLTVFLLFALLFQSLLAGCVARSTETDRVMAKDAYTDAQELKLKIRELADQLLATTPNDSISEMVALPTSFVDLNNKRRTSALGNLFAESLIYEFNQRSYPVCEYRLTGDIDTILGQGDFAMLRQGVMKTIGKKWAALILGTYYVTEDSVLVNARLVRASDGIVLRTAQIILPKNSLIAGMLDPLDPAPGGYGPNGVAHGPNGAVYGANGVGGNNAYPAAAGAAGAYANGNNAVASAYGSAQGGLLSRGKMRIVPAPWKTTGPTRNPGPGLYSSPIQP